MTIKFKKLNDNAQAPLVASAQAAGADLFCASNEDEIFIPPHSTAIVGTGIAVEIPEGYVGLVFARSGVATKRDLAPANKVGVIDSDYRGEIQVAMHNHGEYGQSVSANERIAQLVVVPYVVCEYEQSEELGETERGDGGFGSTGTE